MYRCWEFYCSTSRSADETVITKEYYDKDDDGGTRRGRPANLRVKARTTVRRGDITSSEGEASSLPETVRQTMLGSTTELWKRVYQGFHNKYERMKISMWWSWVPPTDCSRQFQLLAVNCPIYLPTENAIMFGDFQLFQYLKAKKRNLLWMLTGWWRWGWHPTRCRKCHSRWRCAEKWIQV